MHVWSIPSARNSVTDVEKLPIDTPTGEHVSRSRRWPTCASRRRRTPSSASSSRAGSTSAPTSRAATSASVVDDVEDALEGVNFPLGYHAEVLGESTELNAAQDRLLIFGIAAAIAIFLLLQAAFGSLRLAVLTFLLLPMALVGGVLAREARRRRALARLAGRLPHGVRDRRAQRDPDDQPLPAPRAGGGRAVRAGARPARGARSGWRRS